MDPLRWEKIRSAFDDVVELQPAERARRLAAIGSADPELRTAVESLLSADAEADARLAPVESPLRFVLTPDETSRRSPMVDLRAPLQIALGDAYRIERELGGGGMSRVFAAEETALGRRVVVKVFPPELSGPASAERFRREIQLAARLRHPHIVPLLTAGAAAREPGGDGLLYYTMPFVEGESLRARLAREGELPVDAAVHVLRDVARALAYAHRHGVVHRDVKPENILLGEDGALVADFGVAKALGAATQGAGLTGTGVTLGTPSYMAPEQVAADPNVDHRADIYALGVVAYEMLAGQPPFTGTSPQQILAAHATRAPEPVARCRSSVPPALAALVMRCLEKRPADRPQSAEQVLRELETAAAPHEVSSARERARSISRLAASFGVPAALLVLAAYALVVRRSDGAPDPGRAVSFYIDPPAPTGVPENIEAIAISPDGHTLAFVSQSDSSSQVYLRRLSEVQARPLHGTNGAAQVAFSPDGKWLAILTFSGRLLKVAVDGSSILTLAETREYWGGLAWESPHAILLGRAAVAGTGIARIAATGGTPRPLTKPPPAWEHGRPLVTGDGNTLLFVDWGPGYLEDDFLAIGSLHTGEYTRTSLQAAAPLGVVDDWIVYDNSAGAIVAVPFDARSRRTTGDPVRIVEDVTISGALEGALSPTGTLIYKRGQPRQRLVLVDPAGAVHQVTAEERNFLPLFGGRPVLSPDGRRVAVNLAAQRGDTITVDIWTIDRRTGTFARLTSLGDVINPEWTPDGRHLVFSTWESRHPRLWRQLADGTEPPETLLALPEGSQIVSASVTPDGSGITYCAWRIHAASRAEYFYLPLTGDRTPERLDVGPAGGPSCAARVSPNGRWLAYVDSHGATTNVYVRSFRGVAGPVQISAGGGDSPVWSRDGKRLYYRRLEAGLTSGSLVVAQLSATSTGLHVVKRQRLLTLREGGVYDVAPDGQVLVVQQGDSRVQLVVTMNWTSQLRARLAGVK